MADIDRGSGHDAAAPARRPGRLDSPAVSKTRISVRHQWRRCIPSMHRMKSPGGSLHPSRRLMAECSSLTLSRGKSKRTDAGRSAIERRACLQRPERELSSGTSNDWKKIVLPHNDDVCDANASNKMPILLQDHNAQSVRFATAEDRSCWTSHLLVCARIQITSRAIAACSKRASLSLSASISKDDCRKSNPAWKL